jgi:geranylgeranyl diphosphate synthase type I
LRSSQRHGKAVPRGLAIAYHGELKVQPLHLVVDRYLGEIEGELQRSLQTPSAALEGYYGMMRYHLGWTDAHLQAVEVHAGKRIRPLLCLLSAEAAGGDARQAMPAAVAVELAHNFSLVHDDIQDNSAVRRGRPAVWAVWGMAQAITAGDGMFVVARRALEGLQQAEVAPSRCLAAYRAFDRACLALCEGQFLDIDFEPRSSITQEQYLSMIEGKTAALLAASAELGALVVTDEVDRIRSHARWARRVGMAFQIQDDILGIWGDEALTGKSSATDVRDKKKTLPVVFALNQSAEPAVARRLAAILSGPPPLPGEMVEEVMSLLDDVDARGYAVEMASKYYRAAQAELEAWSGPSYDNLRALARALTQRKT